MAIKPRSPWKKAHFAQVAFGSAPGVSTSYTAFRIRNPNMWSRNWCEGTMCGRRSSNIFWGAGRPSIMLISLREIIELTCTDISETSEPRYHPSLCGKVKRSVSLAQFQRSGSFNLSSGRVVMNVISYVFKIKSYSTRRFSHQPYRRKNY